MPAISSGAIAAHEAALALDPSIAQAHANLIVLYGRARDWPKAEAHYRAVVALGFNLADAHYDYGVLLGLQETLGRRGRRLSAGDRRQSRITRARTTTSARSSSGSSKLDAAAAAYRQAVDSQPDVPAGALQSRTDADRASRGRTTRSWSSRS